MATSVVFPPIGGTTYSVPADGEVNWALLSNYLIALASAQGTTSQKKAVRKCITTPVTVVSSSDAVINVQLTTPGAVSVVLPVSPQGQFYSVVDGTGDAATNNITITASGGATINGAASYLIVDNRASVDLIYITAANNWIAISNSSAVSKTLKQVYDASVPARIALTSASGGLELRDAATPLAASLFKVADTTGGVNYINVTSAGITGSNLSGSNTGDQSLDTLTNVAITSKQISDIVSWNGVAWINGPQSTAVGTGGVIFYNATPILVAASANCAIAVGTLSGAPVVTGDVATTVALNASTAAVSAWVSAALNRTTISAGDWSFQAHAGVDSTGGGRVTSLIVNMYRASANQSGTITVTGAGTTRTVTASAGTPFATTKITASATNTNAAYLKTPQGIFQISARTSDTVVTITVLAGYANEAAVAFSTWEKLFSSNSSTVTSITPVYTEVNFNTLQAAYTCAATDSLGSINFGTSTGGAVTLTIIYNGTVNHTYFTSPLAIRHNDLPNLQGGATEEYYHSTLAEYTGSGTGVFVRAAGASIGLVSATGLPLTTGVTGVLPIANGGTNLSALPTSAAASTFAAWDANINLPASNFIEGYATTATAAGTTTLVVGSKRQQYFTGTTTQTVLLPVTSTLVLGQQFEIINLSTGLVSVKSSGSNIIQTMSLGTKLIVTCILTSGTTAASWSFNYASNTGSISGAGIKNYISNPNDANSGWTASAGGIAVTTETTSSLFPDNITQSSAIKILRASGSDYVYTRWTMDAADYSILCGILFAMQYSGTAGDYTLALYTNTASNYGGSYVSVTLPTTSIPAASTGVNFQTNGVAGASGTQYMELRINGIAGTTALYLNAVTFTPNAPAQGAAISEWESWTPTGSWVTNTTYYGKRRRVGSNMEYSIGLGMSGAPTATDLSIDLPSGDVIDTNAIAYAIVYATPFGVCKSYDSGLATYLGAISYRNTTTVYLTSSSASNLAIITNLVPFTFGSSDSITAQFSVPLTRFAGNGTVNLGPGAQVEYASNSSTSNANDTTSFAYGPLGSLIPTITASAGTTRADKTVSFNYPIQPNDMLIVEWQSAGSGPWYEIGTTSTYATFHPQNTNRIGIGIISATSTTLVVTFAYGGAIASGAYGAVGDSYPQSAGDRWRVRKASPSSPVGFGLVSSTNGSGLMPNLTSQLDNATATQLGLKQYLHGTTYNGGIAPTVTGATVITRAVFIPYQTQGSEWRLRCNMDLNVSSGTSQTITINGVVFKSGINGAMAFSANVVTAAILHSDSAAATISCTFASAITNLRISGDVELNSKPTWAY